MVENTAGRPGEQAGGRLTPERVQQSEPLRKRIYSRRLGRRLGLRTSFSKWILQVLALGGAGTTLDDVVAVSEITERTVTRHLKALIADGLVKEVGPRGYAVDVAAVKALPAHAHTEGAA